ncbi:hypothetical protein [Dyadobacter sp. CY343]|uniref:hypothetical protein n=1 Tax=Dyadobacter sp. CY343 TaxID=2907299 RepID=UPI001F3FFCC2|nr:hypothetical protein [Dyadobacter sp. CY343]MCE7059215.1 hypothetical protein [Dyadobacter sp. CY343]
MKKLLPAFLVSLFCGHAHFLCGQAFNRFYKIRPTTTLVHVLYEPCEKDVTTVTQRKVMGEDGNETTVIISETVRKKYSELKTKIVYAPAVNYQGRKSGGYTRANLIQNAKGDSIEVEFWSMDNKGTQGSFSIAAPGFYTTKNGKGATPIDPSESGKYYYVFEKRKDLTSAPLYVERFSYRQFEFGAATMPLKYRFARTKTMDNGRKVDVPADVTTEVNVGFYTGVKWGNSSFYSDTKRSGEHLAFMASIFTGPIKISLAADTLDNTIKKNSNQLGWQFGLGGWLGIKKIELGFFGGVDFPLSKEGRKWDYAYKPWIGFGIGYKLGILKLDN